MSYKTRDKIGDILEKVSREARFYIRRKYLRSGIDRINNSENTLSKEQKKQIKQYWSKYTKHICYKWHSFFYAKTGTFDVRFIPEDIMFTEIEGYFNDWSSAHGVDNKNNYQFYFPFVRQPVTVFRKINRQWYRGEYDLCTYDEAKSLAITNGNIIVKYALDSGTGSGIRFWKTEDGIEALDRIMAIDADLIAQEFFENQHQSMKLFNETSLNTVRLVTFIFENEVRVLAAYLRCGQNGARLDNVIAGGLCCEVYPNGKLYDYAYDKKANKVTETLNGVTFAGKCIPGWKNIVETAKKMHLQLGNFRIISWDFAIDENEQPVFVEMNLKYGAMEYHQLFKGPLFGDDTEKVLGEVYGKRL